MVLFEFLSKEKTEIQNRLSLKKKYPKIIDTVKNNNSLNRFIVIIDCVENKWLEDDAQMLKMENEFDFDIIYSNWDPVVNELLDNETILKKYYEQLYVQEIPNLGNINSIHSLKGSNNIILQDINNSLVIVNKNNTEQFTKLFETAKNQIEDLKELIIKSIDNDETKLMLLKIISYVVPHEYLSERKNITIIFRDYSTRM